MKTITIGRSAECNITIEHELISRRHAILRLYPSGRVEIVDMSSNGTSVNGTKIPANSPRQIHRSDVVTFAGVKALDWSQVPVYHHKYIYGIAAAIAALIVFVGIIGFVSSNSANSTQDNVDDEFTESQNNTNDGTVGSANEDTKEGTGFRWPSFLLGGSSHKSSPVHKAPQKKEETVPQQEPVQPEAPQSAPEPEKPKVKKGPKFVM